MKNSPRWIAPVRLALVASAVTLAAVAIQSCSRNSTRMESAKPAALMPGDGVLEPAGVVEPRPANPPNKVLISPAEPLAPEEQRSTFHLPPGFEIQLVASEPDIQKPMQLAFDEKGRLLASCSRDYPLGPAEGQVPGDSVFLIEVDGETGAATDITTFSSGYNICSGVEALPGGRVILAHAPDILLLADEDADGEADSSEVLYSGFVRWDTHELPNSFTWGADGWLYGLQGHVNESNVKNKAGEVTEIHHGNVFRMRPDGAAIEVWARGMSNPWGLAFDREQRLFGADCESRPIWQIVEGLPYQGFLQDGEPLGFAPYITEDPHGASGFAGLVSYTGRAFPDAYRDCLYMGSPITGIIYRDRPEGAGSTKHLSRRPDFLTSTDPWFRPVDIELGPDGALYIADWYNRIIAHVEVPLDHPDRDKKRGRIWRIVYRGTEREPAGEDRDAIAAQFEGPMAIDWSTRSRRDLLKALSESNGWIRRQAAAQLHYRFPENIERPLRKRLERAGAPDLARLEAFGLLYRGGHLQYGDLVTIARDQSPTIRRQAARAISLAEDQPAKTRQADLVAMLDDPDATVAREAAMGLRHVPSVETLEALLARQSGGADSGGDTLLHYAWDFSLRDHLKLNAILDGAVRSEVASADRLMKYLAATHTPQAAEVQAEWLAAGRIPETYARDVLNNILARAGADTVRSVFHANVAEPDSGKPPLKVYAQALFSAPEKRRRLLDGDALYAAWFPPLAASDDPEARRIALDMAAARDSAGGISLASRMLSDAAAGQRARQTAAQLLLDRQYDGSVNEILAMVADENVEDGVRRALAYELAARASSRERFDALLSALTGAPSHVQQGAVESLARQRPGVTYLLEAVERGNINPVYLNEVLVRIFIDDIHKDPELTARHRRLVESVEDAESRANAQIAKYRAMYGGHANPDIARGQRLVEQNCLVCHRIGGFGALRAPNLDGIGNRGIDRLLQDILQPSKDIDPAFRSTIISTRDGRTEEGFVSSEDDGWVVLVDATGWESDIRKSDILERKKLWVSPMPPDFGATMAEEDFLDMVAFLLNPPDTIRPMTDMWRDAAR